MGVAGDAEQVMARARRISMLGPSALDACCKLDRGCDIVDWVAGWYTGEITHSSVGTLHIRFWRCVPCSRQPGRQPREKKHLRRRNLISGAGEVWCG